MDAAARFRQSLLRRLLRVSAMSALIIAGTGTTGCSRTECFKPAQCSSCPSREEAKTLLSVDCGEELVSVDSDAQLEEGLCCYDITTEDDENSCCPEDGCVVGRPYTVADHAITAQSRKTSAWALSERSPAVCALTAADRQALAAHWTLAALQEHASIASFSRFALELLAAGAPPDLVAEAQNAALDEIQHAKASFAMAAAYRGEPVGPSDFPFGGAVQIRSDLASLAAAVAREGCIGETAAAIVAAEQLARATDPAVLAVLAKIAGDEARHAELAWRTVRWALAEGGAPVHAAVAEVFEALRRGRVAPIVEAPSILSNHGWLDDATRDAVVARAIVEVVLPCARALHLTPFERAACVEMGELNAAMPGRV
jgi:hypothetical protein